MLFPISIANGYIGIAFYLLYLFFDVKPTLKRLSYFAASALSSGLFLLFSYTIAYSIAGIDIVDGIRALQSASQGQMSRKDTSLKLLFNYWSSWSLFGLLASARCIQCARMFLRNKTFSFLDVAWLVLTGLVIAACIFVFGLRAAPVHYNLYAFLPIYQLLSLRLLIEVQLFSRRFWIFICTSALIAASALSLFTPIRSMALFPYYLLSGSTYAQMKQQFEKIETKECSIVYTGAVAFLDEKQSGSNYLRSDSSGIIPTERMKKDGNDFSCEVAFVQETNTNSSFPVGMKLIADLGDRSPYTKKLRSLRILNSPKGYSFKAYRRDATAPAY
jgi:hypothetical protein